MLGAKALGCFAQRLYDKVRIGVRQGILILLDEAGVDNGVMRAC